MSAFTIVSVYPELLGTYGDAGNVIVLERRLAWRRIPVEVVRVGVSEALPAHGDLYVLGGSEDDNQNRALEALRSSSLAQAVAAGAHVFGVCAGLQLLGRTMTDERGRVREGLGMLDIDTTRLRRRAVGDVVASFPAPAGLPVLTGFANHGGGTTLGAAATALAMVTSGRGNTGASRGDAEGAVQGNVVTTYLHGPVLARNPAFADWLLQRASGLALDPLPAGPPEALHDERVAGRS